LPTTEHDITKSIFPITQNGDSFEVQEAEILSPPLVPAITNESFPAYYRYFYGAVRNWIECAQVHDDLEWHTTFFPEEYGKPWARMVFGQVCDFFHEVTLGRCPALKACLGTTVLVYMLGHSFYVPPDDVPGLLSRTKFGAKYDRKPTSWVSPAYVDRFIKILLYPIYKGAVEASFKGLQELYAPARPSKFTRDRLLAISIIMLIVAASQQSKAIEKAIAQRRKNNPIDARLVYSQVLEIEKEIIDMILDLWNYKFSSTTKFPEEGRENRIRAIKAEDFDIMERFYKTYQNFGESTIRLYMTQ